MKDENNEKKMFLQMIIIIFYCQRIRIKFLSVEGAKYFFHDNRNVFWKK